MRGNKENLTKGKTIKTTKKALALLLAALLAFGTFAMTVSAEAEKWDGSVPANAPGGYDETSSPITLDSAEEFVWFFRRVGSGTKFSGKTVQLTVDVDHSGKVVGLIKKAKD